MRESRKRRTHAHELLPQRTTRETKAAQDVRVDLDPHLERGGRRGGGGCHSCHGHGSPHELDQRGHGREQVGDRERDWQSGLRGGQAERARAQQVGAKHESGLAGLGSSAGGRGIAEEVEPDAVRAGLDDSLLDELKHAVLSPALGTQGGKGGCGGGGAAAGDGGRDAQRRSARWQR